MHVSTEEDNSVYFKDNKEPIHGSSMCKMMTLYIKERFMSPHCDQSYGCPHAWDINLHSGNWILRLYIKMINFLQNINT